MELNCVFCQKPISLSSDHVGRKEECPHCYGDLHSCRACKFYDTTAYNECREPMADRIVEKDKANFCDYYSLKTQHNAVDNSANDALKAAMDLFKKK